MARPYKPDRYHMQCLMYFIGGPNDLTKATALDLKHRQLWHAPYIPDMPKVTCDVTETTCKMLHFATAHYELHITPHHDEIGRTLFLAMYTGSDNDPTLPPGRTT